MQLPGSQDSRKAALLERVAITAGLILFFVTGYFGVEISGPPAVSSKLELSLDSRIPFIPASVWVYLGVFPFALAPVFMVKCPRLFRRMAAAYALAIGIGCLSFLVFRESSEQLRISQGKLDAKNFSEWAIRVLYSVDPPANLFPSLHVAIASLAAIAVWKAKKAYGLPAILGLAFFLMSVSTTKQHRLLDIPGGLVLALAAAWLALRTYRASGSDSLAYSWNGLCPYAFLWALFYAGFWLAFTSGR